MVLCETSFSCYQCYNARYYSANHSLHSLMSKHLFYHIVGLRISPKDNANKTITKYKYYNRYDFSKRKKSIPAKIGKTILLSTCNIFSFQFTWNYTQFVSKPIVTQFFIQQLQMLTNRWTRTASCHCSSSFSIFFCFNFEDDLFFPSNVIGPIWSWILVNLQINNKFELYICIFISFKH